MLSPLAVHIIGLLELAETKPHGIAINIYPLTPIPTPILRAKQEIYKVRKELSPRFDNIQVIIDPTNPESKLWLIPRSSAPNL